MTGAGSAELAFVKESSFKTLPGTPTYYEPGRDPVIQDLELSRALTRQRMPGEVFSSESLAGNIEGAFGVQFVMDAGRQADVHDIVFNSSAPYTLSPGLAASSRWYASLDYVGGTAERELIGCVPVDYQVEYQRGGDILVSITFVYADEQSNASITPSSINEATGASARFHGMTLDIGTTTQVKEQSATLSISNMSRLERGSDAVAIDAVVGPATAALDFEGIISSTQSLELAYGGSGQTSTSATMSSVSGSMALSASGSTVTTYSLAEMTPDTYAWQDLINADASTTERVTFNVDGEPAVEAT